LLPQSRVENYAITPSTTGQDGLRPAGHHTREIMERRAIRRGLGAEIRQVNDAADLRLTGNGVDDIVDWRARVDRRRVKGVGVLEAREGRTQT
jgi:hypothetical protein